MDEKSKVTLEEWQAYLNELFAPEINGIKRPEGALPANLVFNTQMPEWIRMDPLRYDLMNAFFRQLLSNDHQLDTKIEEKINSLTQGKNIKIETTEDGKIVISVDGDLGINMLKRNQAYAVGDVAYVPALPTWARLDCTAAGTTAENEPEWENVSVGQEITDGTVTWTVRDVKNALYAP